jgi:hypothetical protein
MTNFQPCRAFRWGALLLLLPVAVTTAQAQEGTSKAWTEEALRKADAPSMTARQFRALSDDADKFAAMEGKPVEITGRVFNMTSYIGDLIYRPRYKGQLVPMLSLADPPPDPKPNSPIDLDTSTVVNALMRELPWEVTKDGEAVTIRGIAARQGMIEDAVIVKHTDSPTPAFEASELVKASLADEDVIAKKVGIKTIVVHGKVVSIEEEKTTTGIDVAVIVAGHNGKNARLLFGGKNGAAYYVQGIKSGDRISVLGSFAHFNSKDDLPFELSACQRFVPATKRPDAK